MGAGSGSTQVWLINDKICFYNFLKKVAEEGLACLSSVSLAKKIPCCTACFSATFISLSPLLEVEQNIHKIEFLFSKLCVCNLYIFTNTNIAYC